ncbi:MAG: hypothetical protein ABH856_04040 [Patescibacteria group bacterium]|nr:hypothetical protein [Patescibacteria group bacterium]
MIKKLLARKPAPKWGESIVFYCKDCEKTVETQQVGRKYVYKCKVCGTKNVAFGTPRSIKGFFHIEEEGKK